MAFYATVATVIPVLFIVLVVQGTTYQEMLRVMRSLRARQDSSRRSRVVTTAGRVVVGYGALAILAAGMVGEFSAILALYWGYDSPAARLAILVLAGFLILMVVAGPLLELGRAGMIGPDGRPGGPDDGGTAPPAAPVTPSGRAGRDPGEADAGNA